MNRRQATEQVQRIIAASVHQGSLACQALLAR